MVIALAAAWHVGLALFERHLRPEHDRPSLAKLLLLAEVEALRTLRAELRRRREGRKERKLSQVEERLKELSEDEAEADV